MSLFDGRQIAAARPLANVGAKELAEAASVTPRAIGRLEAFCSRRAGQLCLWWGAGSPVPHSFCFGHLASPSCQRRLPTDAGASSREGSLTEETGHA
jgi:hypothetical protein